MITTRIIDGNALSRRVRDELSATVTALATRGIRPRLAVVIVGEDPASQVYVRNKARACAEVGVGSDVHRLAGDTPESDLLGLIGRLNDDPTVHGILVQLPLPRHIASHKALATIAPHKDVDGFHVANVGALVTGNPVFVPCTPAGIIEMLERSDIPLWGRHAVVIGASNIVGKPVAMLMLQRGATITICNSKTPDLGAMARQADVLVVATGRAGIVNGSMVKPGAAVIDVGINRTPEGKLVGDVDLASCQGIAGWITPVPGGVGPMTVTMLIANTVAAADRAARA